MKVRKLIAALAATIVVTTACAKAEDSVFYVSVYPEDAAALIINHDAQLPDTFMPYGNMLWGFLDPEDRNTAIYFRYTDSMIPVAQQELIDISRACSLTDPGCVLKSDVIRGIFDENHSN